MQCENLAACADISEFWFSLRCNDGNRNLDVVLWGETVSKDKVVPCIWIRHKILRVPGTEHSKSLQALVSVLA